MNIKSNLTGVLLLIGVLFIVALVALLILFDKPIDGYVGSLTTIGALIVSMGLLGGRIDKVSKNVNGNQTRLLNENAYLRERNAALEQAAVSQGTGPVAIDPEVLMTEETVERIKADRDSLPAHRADV